MNVSSFDCPQYVCFESESFLDDFECKTETSEIKNDSKQKSSYLLRETPSRLLNKANIENVEGYLEFSKPLKYVASPENQAGECIRVQSSSPVVLQESTNLTSDFPVLRKQKTSSNANLPHKVCKSTIPKPFQFKTNDRVKDKPHKNSDYKEQDFKMQLRKNTLTQTAKVPHVTAVQPFHLKEPTKRKRNTDEYLPLAEQVAAFQKKTPRRFRPQKDDQPLEHWSPHSCKPQSPKLQAVKRCRPVTALSKEEEEAKEFEEMKAYQFHARPLEPKIFNKPVFKISPKPKTKPKDIQLKTESRAKIMYGRKKEDEEQKYKFRSRPVPKSVYQGPSGLKTKEAIPKTHPKSPAFALKERAEKWKSHAKLHCESPIKVFKQSFRKAHPGTAAPVPFTVKYEKKRTEVEPFSFDQKDQERQLRKKRKIEEEIERERKAHEFRAQPMPSPSPSTLPAVLKKPATAPQPFQFLSEQRVSKHNFTFTEETVMFKAQPATVLKKEPFLPEKPVQAPIEFLHAILRDLN
ncbi:targeting protein for Xklp2-like isoform X2 [Stegodyphus dumicola]|uniref:targeting protein for Xklp2-like isoform X2 n=1 Tax=Stegodyphus dumicola TaxID=202533 RepID=UPI0015AC3AB4|nr:targeting protein for Xklp2-like isoform X2 [Stegodyphus dumicola]